MAVILLQCTYLAAVGFCFATAEWLMLRAEKNLTTRTLVMCQLLIIVWCMPQLFLVFVSSRGMKYALYGISYVGISFIGPCWLAFSRLYSRKRLSPRAGLLLFGIAAFDYGMFLTNGLHRLFYRSFQLDQVVYGPVFCFHTAFSYVCVIWGMAIVLQNFRKNRVDKRHVTIIILAAVVPLIFNMLYLSGTVKSGFDLTPPVFALSSFLMLVAVFRYDFLDIHVAASRQIFASMSEGIIVCNQRGKVTCCNQAVCGYVDVKNGDEYETVLRRLQEKCSREGDDGERAWEDLERDGAVLDLLDGRKVRLKQYHIRGRRGKETAVVLLLTDVGEYYELLRQNRELAISEQRLAIERERNRIAQEVHDTTGHTLTMIQSLTKLARIGFKGKEPENGGIDAEILDYLCQAQELAADGIRQLRWSINHLRMGCDGQLVSQGVRQLADSVKELKVDVEIQGEDSFAYSHLSRVVYQCLREAVTNCLKYAQAAHMDVIVKFGENGLGVYIFDDGQGCGSIDEHNGLSGIRQRIAGAGGQVRFRSAAGEGFQIFFELPLGKEQEPQYKEGGKR
ncbi:MAG: hypothetical protein HFG74_00680 [Hungatella sp.]|nr:hypothetical protein [Hungatella sp.]